MRNVSFNFRSRLSRRTLLRGAGAAMALPWLDAMSPAFANRLDAQSPRRFVSMSLALGLHGPNLFPEETGRGYKPSVYLEHIQDVLGDLTVFSGVSHTGVSAGHQAEACILTGAPLAGGGSGGFRNTISLDQLMAKHLGGDTRYPSLVMSPTDTTSPSYTENGAMIPAERSPQKLFDLLFVDETPAQQRRSAQRLKEGRSIMDIVAAEAKSLEGEVGPGDRQKLDSYFTSVRDLEKRLAAGQEWVARPKPKVDAAPPPEIADKNDLGAHQRAMLDIIFLALQTDSTRFMTMHLNGGNQVLPVNGVSEGYHSLSHHGKDPSKIAQLTLVEKELLGSWAGFVRKLKATQDGSGTLLDSTMALFTSNLGNASSHDTKNMPVLLAGGGFRHGQHLGFDRDNNYPLCNLYLQMALNAGLEIRSFGTSVSETVTGFENA